MFSMALGSIRAVFSLLSRNFVFADLAVAPEQGTPYELPASEVFEKLFRT